jgi:hypothetical protein
MTITAKIALIAFLSGMLLGLMTMAKVSDYTIQKIEYRYAMEKLAAEKNAREKLQAEINKSNEVVNNAKAQTNAAIGAANRASESAARLRIALDNLRASNQAATPRECQAASNSVDLLSDMLGRMEQHGRELASEADKRGIAGAACEAILSQ